MAEFRLFLFWSQFLELGLCGNAARKAEFREVGEKPTSLVAFGQLIREYNLQIKGKLYLSQ